MMRSTMMDEPLGTRLIAERGERLFGQSIVHTFDGAEFSSASYAEVADRARRLASGLAALGVSEGDRVATFMWNRQEHLEAYLAVPSMGAVLHTLNVRLFAEQVGWIIDHAEDMVLLIDSALLPAAAEMLSGRAGLQHVVVVGPWDGNAPPGLEGRINAYEDLLAERPFRDWPRLDEHSAAAMCYTSGTTGHPKGVVYSHRSIFLHSLASLGSDAFGISNRDRILMLPAMFHAHAWGMPYSGWFAGADMVMPGPNMQPDKIARMAAAIRPTLTAAVPTILNDLLALGDERQDIDLSSFRSIIAGGSAVPQRLIERMKARFGVDVIQGWGMTETSPMCVLSIPPRDVPPEEESAWRAKSGRPVAGMEVRIVGDEGECLPHDDVAVGRLQLRGPWVASGYYRQEDGRSPLTGDGWLDTGDVGTIDPRGYVRITDRTKDLIKSGGEWISSIDLEREIVRLPGIMQAAVVAVPDPRWDERPLAVIVRSGSDKCDFAELRAALARRVAKFMVPEYWAEMKNLPKTSIGKIDKERLRLDARSGALHYSRETGLRNQNRP